MQTAIEKQKKRLERLNRELKHRQNSNIQLNFKELMELTEKEQHLIDAVVSLLSYDSSVIEAEATNISANLLWALKDANIEKGNGINAIIHALQLFLKTAEARSNFNDMVNIGRTIEVMKQAEIENAKKEYTVSEFAKRTNLHPHTVRARYKRGELQGRQDNKGIFILASELEKFKPKSNTGE